MPNLEVKRKLAAILSADVEGYSRLMTEDEVGTIHTLSTYRRAISKLVQQHRGRVVDAPGDNLLAEFISVVDAVNCAVEIQRELAEQNQELPEDKRMHFRIGVNLGDVVEEEDRIYGDGVNIAARLESLAESGGICISATVYDHVKNKVELEYEHIGEQTVKNISEPVVVYRVLSYPGAAAHRVIRAKKVAGKKRRNLSLATAAVLILTIAAGTIWNFYLRPSRPQFEVASVGKMSFPLPDKPSIAVLPFDNLSGDSNQEYIADGFTENIITGLSQISEMFVIARNSVFTYKGKPVKVKQVSEELGVRYILEGSVQRADERLRVTAQLIDAIKGHHLWAQRYDRELKDLFNLQDEITMEILTALQMKLTRGELANTYRTDNFDAWGHISKGLSLLNRLTKGDLLRAREHFEQAKNLDPDYWPAWAMLAWTHTIEVLLGLSKSPDQSIKQAIELAQKTAELGADQASLHSLMNRIYRVQGKLDQAIAEGKKAVALNPNGARPHIFLAESLHYGGRPEEAISHARKAMRLEPYYPAWFLIHLAGPYAMLGRYEEAIETWKQLLERSLKGELPPIFGHERLVLNYARLDRMADARVHVKEILKIKPDYSVEFFRKTTLYKDRAYLESLVDLLIKAGLPEHPPLELPDKPSIAVLPFVNMSDDPKQEYFSDGITENIISSLAKVHNLFVIARNSTFTYKGKAVKIQQVAKELGVRYVLEGSVQKTEDRVRITAQLIDAIKGTHIWAERYDSDLTDIFDLQDEITKKIITSLHVKLTIGEDARLSAQSTENLEAYLKLLEGHSHAMRLNKDANILARQYYEEALALDPDYIFALVNLAWTHTMDASYGWVESRAKSLETAEKLAQKALLLDDSFGGTYGVLGSIQNNKGNVKEAVALRKKAVALAPNSANYHALLGLTLIFMGNRTEEAIKELKIANRLDPFPPNWILHYLGEAYRVKGEYEKAIAVFKRAIKNEPDYWLSHVSLSTCYGLLGREEEARAAAEEVLRVDPKFTIAKVRIPYRNSEDKLRTIEVLKKAGLK